AQAEGQRVVRVFSLDVGAVVDEHAPTFGIVVNVDHERCGSLSSAQIDVHSLKQVRFIEGWTIDAVVRSGDGHGPVERIETTAARKDLVFKRRFAGPIERYLVLPRQLAAACERVTLEVIFIGNDDTRLIKESNRFTPSILCFRIGLAFAIGGTADKTLRSSAFAQEGFCGASQGIVCCAELVAAAVPGVDRF